MDKAHRILLKEGFRLEILDFIREDSHVLVAVLWVLGSFLKRTPSVANWTIPWILLVIGIILALSLLGISLQSVIQGILVTGGAVLVHQLGKQTKNRNKVTKVK
jgi:protein-S-isoprenylcysteine O-methyltransferase Ste14